MASKKKAAPAAAPLTAADYAAPSGKFAGKPFILGGATGYAVWTSARVTPTGLIRVKRKVGDKVRAASVAPSVPARAPSA